jgi:translation elongation factor EF-Tu-like GTPase
MKEKSTYQINDTFKITGRGIVFVGNISSGLVSIGDWIEFNFKGSTIRRKINGIEGIRSLKEENNCGLVIEAMSREEIEDLKNWEPNRLIAKIHSQSTNET